MPEFLNRTPLIEEYIHLCDSVGWTDFMNYEAAETSLNQSLFAVTVKENDRLIGMGRIIGDGAIYFYIQDIVVHPDYQGKGIGKEIMQALLQYLKEHAPDKSFVGLFASEGKTHFYENFGFQDYSPGMTGMFQVIEK